MSIVFSDVSRLSAKIARIVFVRFIFSIIILPFCCVDLILPAWRNLRESIVDTTTAAVIAGDDRKICSLALHNAVKNVREQ